MRLRKKILKGRQNQSAIFILERLISGCHSEVEVAEPDTVQEENAATAAKSGVEDPQVSGPALRRHPLGE